MHIKREISTKKLALEDGEEPRNGKHSTIATLAREPNCLIPPLLRDFGENEFVREDAGGGRGRVV